MLATVYLLLFCTHLGCAPVDSGLVYRTYAACVQAKRHRTDICSRETNYWIEK